MRTDRLGDFHFPAEDDNYPLREARSKFLEAIRQVAPEVLEELRDTVFPRFTAAVEVLTERDLTVSSVEGTAQVLVLSHWDALRTNQEIAQVNVLVCEIERWSANYNLGVDWFKQDALSTLYEWQQNRKKMENLEWLEPSWLIPLVNGQFPELGPDLSVNFSFRHWRPDYEPWLNFEKQAFSSFKTYLSEYREYVSGYVKSLGYEETKAKRKDWHYVALARYHVKKMSYVEIAQAHTLDDPSGDRAIGDDAVRKAVEAESRKIGLPIRK